MKKHLKILFLPAAVLCLGFLSIEGLSVSTTIRIAPTSKHSEVFGGAYLLFAGKFGGEIKRSEIDRQRELSVEGCAKGSKIFKYTLSIKKGEQSFTYQASGNTLTDEMVTRLKGLSGGDSFEFTQIKAYLPDGKEVVEVHGKKFIVI